MAKISHRIIVRLEPDDQNKVMTENQVKNLIQSMLRNLIYGKARVTDVLNEEVKEDDGKIAEKKPGKTT